MKLAIMQPYFFPYLGYFQLMAAVDRFVLLDDVNFIKRGWINRNRIFSNGNVQWMTVPLRGASQNQLIHEVSVDTPSKAIDKLLRSIAGAYRSAPQYSRVMPLVEETLRFELDNLSEFLHHSLMLLVEYLQLACEIIPTARAYPKHDLTGKDRIIDICLREQATEYFNLPGGRELYEPAEFSEKGISLQFISPQLEPYGAHGELGLSILDVMMHVERAEAVRMIHQVELEAE